jgi:NAD(P) transhydrogenase subunit beta
MTSYLIQITYLIGSALFIMSLRWMSDPKTARRGVFAGVIAMLLAILGTLMSPEIVVRNVGWIALAVAAGFVVGIPLSLVPLTAVPQRTALSHAFGGLAAGLVGTAKYFLWLQESPADLTAFRMTAIIVEILLGYLTFTGSLMADRKSVV